HQDVAEPLARQGSSARHGRGAFAFENLFHRTCNRGESRATRDRLNPGTLSRSDTRANGPFSRRYARIAKARTRPIPGRAVRSASEAELSSSGTPERPSDFPP